MKQAYVFQGMMVNEFKDRVYSCGFGCQCMYWKMGWYSHRDYRCLQIIGLDCFNFEAFLGWKTSYWNQVLTMIPSNTHFKMESIQ